MDKAMSLLISSTLANPTTSYYALAGAAPAPAEFVTGMILMFNGITAPTGFQYCDGTNGTPDLRDRFVLCSTATYPLGSTGGSLSSTLGLTNLPDHSHGGAAVLGSGGTAGINDSNVSGIGGNTTGITSPGWTAPQPFSIVPPYYALAYIMKL